MNTSYKIGVTMLLLLAASSARAENIVNTTPSTSEEVTAPRTIIIEKKTQQPKLLMTDLHSHLLELQDTLSEQTYNTTLVKTRTSWIRMQLRTLNDWAIKQDTSENTVELFDRLRVIVSKMQQEVERDDMLDNVETQILLVDYTQIEKILSDIERKQAETTSPPAKNTD